MPRVRFINELVEVDVPTGTALRDVAIKNNVELYRGMWTHVNCRGHGICRRCRIWVASSNSADPRAERAHRGRWQLRLACWLKVEGDIDVRTRPIGPALEQSPQPASPLPPPAYREAANERYQETLAEEKKAAEAAVRKKAEEAAKAKEEAAKAKEEKAKEGPSATATPPTEKPAVEKDATTEPATAETAVDSAAEKKLDEKDAARTQTAGSGSP